MLNFLIQKANGNISDISKPIPDKYKPSQNKQDKLDTYQKQSKLLPAELKYDLKRRKFSKKLNLQTFKFLQKNQEENFKKTKSQKQKMLPKSILHAHAMKYIQDQYEDQSSQFQFKNLFGISNFVNKFIENLKSKLCKFRYEQLSKKHFQIISDQSYVEDQEQSEFNTELKNYKKSLFRKLQMNFLLKQISQRKQIFYIVLFHLQQFIMECLTPLKKLYLEKIPVIKPSSQLKFIWDFFILLLLSLFVYLIPMRNSFHLPFIEEDQFNISIQKAIWSSSILLLLIDIMININSSYYNEGQFEENKIKIAKFYLKNRLFLDLMGIFSLISGLFIESSPLIQQSFLIQIVKIKRLLNTIEDQLQLSDQIQNIFDLVKLILTVLFLAHFCACTWHWIGMTQFQQGKSTWLYNNKLYDQGWIQRYLISFYQSVLTMCTVGSINTDSFHEQACSILIVFALAGTFAFAINSLGQILNQISIDSHELKTRLRKIKYYMKYRNINSNLQMKIRRYIENQFYEEKYGRQRGENIFESLSKNL